MIISKSPKVLSIALITFHAVSNHGSVLQTFATKKKFESKGLKVDIINFKKEECKGIFPLIKFWNQDVRNPIKKFLRAIILFPSFVRWKYMFAKFLKNRVEVDINSKSYTSDKEFDSLPLTSDIYCVGSDQVWNSIWNNGIVRPLFLSFVPDKYPKVAYSSSFGRTSLYDWEKPIMSELLGRFDVISVREQSGLNILNELGISNAEAILDPTLLMDKAFWMEYTPQRKIKEDYVLVYQLYSNRDFDLYAERTAKELGCKLVRFCTRYDQLLKNGRGYLAPEIEDFLSLIRYARLLITDSFHGTAFAVNLNVDFISYIPKYGGRIYNLLNIVSLSDRAITSFDNKVIAKERINFQGANKVLEMERAKADRYLDKMISICTDKINAYSNE